MIYLTTIEGPFNTVNNTMLTYSLAKPGERVVIISGVPFGEAGSTNFVKIQEIQ